MASSFLLSPGYEATTKILLPNDGRTGSASAEAALSQTQVVTSFVVLDRTAAALGWGMTGADLDGSVTAAPVDGGVLEIVGVASTPDRARMLVDGVVREYSAFADPIVAARSSYTALASGIDPSRGAAQSAITVLQPGVVTGPATPTLLDLVLGGVVVFAVGSLVALLVARQSDRRLHDVDDVAAALGAPVLATVEAVAGPPSAGVRKGGLTTRIGAFLRAERRPVVDPVDVERRTYGNDVRYRRVVERLTDRSAGGATFLVLVSDQDQTAGPVAEAAVAAASGRYTELSTGPDRSRPSGRSPRSARLLSVDLDRPSVPVVGSPGPTLLVLTAGGATAWQLIELARTSEDAGRPISGALLVSPLRADGSVENVPAPPPDVKTEKAAL